MDSQFILNNMKELFKNICKLFNKDNKEVVVKEPEVKEDFEFSYAFKVKAYRYFRSIQK